MTTSFLIGFFGWPLYVASCIVLNWYKIEKQKKRPVYFASNQWRIFFGLVCLLVMSAGDGFNGIDFAYPRTLLPYIPHAIYIWCSFGLFFDPGLNIARGKPIDYRGNSSGLLDPVLSRGMWWALKIVCLLGVLWSIKYFWYG